MPHALCGPHGVGCLENGKAQWCASRCITVSRSAWRKLGGSPATRCGTFDRNQAVVKRRSRRARLTTVCMANQRRVARVSKQLEREIGALLQGDQVVVNAICPEHQLGYDSSMSALASVTEVRLSSDLQVAKVYLSIYSDEEGKAIAMRGLSRLQGYVRSRVASQMQLRLVPEIRFIHDDAAERGEEVLQLLERIKRQDAGQEDLPPVAIASLPDEKPETAIPAAETQGGDDMEDGFLDLGEFDQESGEGFLDDLDEDVLLEDTEDSEEGDRTNEVIEEYLAGMRISEGTAEGGDNNISSRKGGRKRKRKYRSKTR